MSGGLIMKDLKEKGINYDKVKFDRGKPRLALVPPAAIKAIGFIMSHGVDKYYENSWKEVEPERWRDALMRHWCEYIDDPYGLDSDSGLPHLWHIIANAAILCGLEDAYIQEVLQENRDTVLSSQLKHTL